MTRRERTGTPAAPLPYRVARWGKFWSLEPVFGDERTYLTAKGGLPPHLDDLVLAVPVHGDRRRIVEVLGPADDLAAVLRALLWAKGVRQGFDDDVADEAAAVAARAARADDGRRDLAGLPTFTIDPDTARDFDDAISVAAEPGGGYRAHVHIADVSYFVDEDGAIDREARRRTSSVYLPLFAEPMLPAALSSDLCSLVPRQPRKCMTVEFAFDGQGRRTAVQFYRSLIHSDHRLTYGFADAVLAAAGADGAALGLLPAGAGREAAAEAAAALPEASDLEALRGAPSSPAGAPDEPPPLPSGPPAAVPDATTEADEALVVQLRLAYELAVLLRRRRFARGALVLGSFEPEYRFTAAGELLGASARPETASHALVEEFMLAANEAVAEFLLKRRAPAIYRVHEPPDRGSAVELWEALEELGLRVPPLPGGEHLEPGLLASAYGRLTRVVAETVAREGRGRIAFGQRVLRSLKQARYAPSNLGHFGLASPAYLHFTSPIRRYPDLVVHRAVAREIAAAGGAPPPADELLGAAEACSTVEREFSRLELDADAVALCFLLDAWLTREGWETEFEGEIVGLVPSGVFIHFGGCYEGFLPLRRLGTERYHLSDHETAQVGDDSGRRLRLGDPIRVRVERVDRLRGRVDLVPAVEPGQGPHTRPGRVGSRRSLDAAAAEWVGRSYAEATHREVGGRMPREQGQKSVAVNRKARHDYFIDETLEAGLVLVGTEVKSLREGRVTLRDSYAEMRGDEIYLVGVHIPIYAEGGIWNHEPLRPRKLLLHRRELDRLAVKVKERGYTLVPTKLYFKDGRAKVEIGLARGKKQYDKRQDMARRDAQRSVERALRGRGEE